jgi:hypothetical protein
MSINHYCLHLQFSHWRFFFFFFCSLWLKSFLLKTSTCDLFVVLRDPKWPITGDLHLLESTVNNTAVLKHFDTCLCFKWDPSPCFLIHVLRFQLLHTWLFVTAHQNSYSLNIWTFCLPILLAIILHSFILAC